MAFDFKQFVNELKDKDSDRFTKTRKINVKRLRSYILIVCEGTETEPNYFESFRIRMPNGSLKKVTIKGTGKNTRSLLEQAKEYNLERNESRLPNFDQVWVVFDRDSFPKDQVNGACQEILDNGFKSAFSNEAFELWYILHFQYLDSACSRKDYIKILDGILLKRGLKKYSKNSSDIYEILLDYGDQDFAISNAKKLRLTHINVSPVEKFPSTRVDLLVEELNLYIEY